MELYVYSLFDAAAQAFTQPFFMHNDGLAIRAFQDNINSPEPSNVSEHPDQFTLYKIATFDDKTGAIDKLDPPRSLGLGITFKQETTIVTAQYESLKQELMQINEQIKTLNRNTLTD